MREQLGVPSVERPRSTRAAVASRYALLEEKIDEEQLYAPRSPSSVRRYQPCQPVAVRTQIQVTRHTIPPRATAQRTSMQKQSRPYPAYQQTAAPRLHWLTGVGLGMLAMLVGWILLSLAVAWWHGAQDDWQYGRPRTFQIDAVVGHSDSPAHPSHFLAQHLGNHYYVIELAGGDPANVRVIVPMTAIGPEGDLTPITLQFADVNHDGRPDMLVQVGATRTIFINDHGAFRPAKAGDVVGG